MNQDSGKWEGVFQYTSYFYLSVSCFQKDMVYFPVCSKILSLQFIHCNSVVAELNGWIHKFFSMHIFLSVFHLPLSSSLNSVLNTLFLFYYPYDVFFFPFYSSSLDPLSSSILKSLLLSKYSLLVLHLFPPPTMQCFLKMKKHVKLEVTPPSTLTL